MPLVKQNARAAPRLFRGAQRPRWSTLVLQRISRRCARQPAVVADSGRVIDGKAATPSVIVELAAAVIRVQRPTRSPEPRLLSSTARRLRALRNTGRRDRQVKTGSGRRIDSGTHSEYLGTSAPPAHATR